MPRRAPARRRRRCRPSARARGRRVRRDCLVAATSTCIPLARAFSPRSPRHCDHAARRLPRHDLVDAALGGGLDRLVVAVALRQRLHEHEPRARAPASSSTPTRPAGRAWPGPTATTSPSTRSARAVGEQQVLPHPGAPHGGGVPALRPVEHDDAADAVDPAQGLGGRGTVQRQGQSGLEGVAQLAEERRPRWAVASRPSGRSSPRSGGQLRAAAPPAAASSLVGRLHLDVHDEVAAPGAAQVGDAQAAQGDDVAGLGAGPHVELARAVEGLQRRAWCPAPPRSSGPRPCSAGRRRAAGRSGAVDAIST